MFKFEDLYYAISEAYQYLQNVYGVQGFSRPLLESVLLKTKSLTTVNGVWCLNLDALDSYAESISKGVVLS